MDENRGLAQFHAQEEAEKEKEIAVAATTMLLAAFTVTVLSPFVAYVFHFAY